MSKINVLIIAGTLFLVTSVFAIFTIIKDKAQPAPPNAAFVLYYGNTCPHCKIVEDYLAQNDPQNKLGIEQKEVFGSTANLDDMKQKAQICKLDLNNLGVPLLWDNATQKCYEGDQPIIDLLKTK